MASSRKAVLLEEACSRFTLAAEVRAGARHLLEGVWAEEYAGLLEDVARALQHIATDLAEITPQSILAAKAETVSRRSRRPNKA